MYHPVKNKFYETNKAIKNWCDDNIENIVPAVIVGVSDYSSDRTVNVQPMTKIEKDDGHVIVPPIIEKVNVPLQGNTKGFTSYPPEIGDTVAVGFCKRSTEEFTYSRGSTPVTPVDNMTFTKTHAVVLGYWGRVGVDKPVSADNFVMNFMDTTITITPENNLTINNGTEIIELSTSGINITSPSNITINSNVVIQPNGNITTTGSITAEGNITSEQTVNGADVTTDDGANLDTLRTAYNAHSTSAPEHPPGNG